MKHYQNVIIGFGKGGKTLAGALRAAGQTVALIEKSKGMYGGTCINVACIPTKSLEHSARLSAAMGGDFAAKAGRYQAAIAEKGRLTAMLRQKNYDKLIGAGVEVLDGAAEFADAHTVLVHGGQGTEQVYGERIFINTGSRPFVPPVPGMAESPYCFTSETLMERGELPRELLVLGGGYIGLEFASYYTNFGSQVTVLQDGEAFIPREDAEVAAAVRADLERRGVRILTGVQAQSVHEKEGRAVLQVLEHGQERALAADAILVATGRRPNLEGLHPEKAGVALTNRGAVQVDEHLQTGVPHIWAMGDVAGGLQFTYISLDDSRIVKSALLGDGSRTVNNRGAVPYSVFIDPPLSRVGLTEAEAREKGFAVKIGRLPAAAIPKAQVLQKPQGLLKVIADAKTDKILGAHLFCAESQEVINLVKLAMDAGLTTAHLRDAIYTHPTMSEALNDLMAAVQ